MLTAAAPRLAAIIGTVIASCKMTFPLLNWMGLSIILMRSLSLSFPLLQHFMFPLTSYLSAAEIESVFVNIPVRNFTAHFAVTAGGVKMRSTVQRRAVNIQI